MLVRSRELLMQTRGQGVVVHSNSITADHASYMLEPGGHVRAMFDDPANQVWWSC